MKNIPPINLLNREQMVKDMINVNKERILQETYSRFDQVKEFIDGRSEWERLIEDEATTDSETDESVLEGFRFKLIPKDDPVSEMQFKELGLYKFFSFLDEKGELLEFDKEQRKNLFCFHQPLQEVKRLKDLLKLPDDVHKIMSKIFKESGLKEYNYNITVILNNKDGSKIQIVGAIIKKLL